MSAVDKPLPDLDDPITAEYWRAARDHRLVVPRCAACGYRFWPPEVVCPECQHREFHWEEVGPTGVLWSYATYHQALDAAFADELPYTVGLVDLGDGIKMYGIVRAPAEQLKIDQTVRASFEAVTSDTTMVRWTVEET
jgi:uncharacterized OB-fold protein